MVFVFAVSIFGTALSRDEILALYFVSYIPRNASDYEKSYDALKLWAVPGRDNLGWVSQPRPAHQKGERNPRS